MERPGPGAGLPLALSGAGVALCAIALVAAVESVSKDDLFVDEGGAVCDGGSVLSRCYTLDRSQFHPDLPDLSSYKPNGFGFIEPAQVDGGTLYVSQCRVVAVELNGYVSSRSGFGWLGAVASLRWAVVPGVLILLATGIVQLRRPQTSSLFRRVVYAALASETATGLLLLLLTIASRQPFSNSLAAATLSASVLAFLVLLGGVTTAAVLTILLWRSHPARNELLLAGGQTGVALALVLGLMSFSAWFVTHLFC